MKEVLPARWIFRTQIRINKKGFELSQSLLFF